MSEHICELTAIDSETWETTIGVEVVRCRDCAKWSFFDTEDGKRIGDCSEWTHLDGFSHATNEDGFCAWGERK